MSWRKWRERRCYDSSVRQWLIFNFLYVLFYSFTVVELRLSNLLSNENQFLKELSWLSNAGLKRETCAWLLANRSHSAEMTFLSSWKYSVHCSSIAIRMCHGGWPVWSSFVSFLLPVWLNSFKCINDNWGFILIHTSACAMFLSVTLFEGEERGTYPILNHGRSSTGFVSCSLCFSRLLHFYIFILSLGDWLLHLFSCLAIQTLLLHAI